MELIDPFEVSKGIESPKVTVLRALVPTGAHVGHGRDLKVVRNSGGKGGPATALQVYRHKSRGQSQGPFGKALTEIPRTGRTAARVTAAWSKPVGTPASNATDKARLALRGSMRTQDPSSTGRRIS